VTIDILCKVVDNFGDIGVAWRLARALSELPDPPGIRLVVDDLESFAALCPRVDPSSGYQDAGKIEVVPWRGEPGPAVLESYGDSPPAAVVECFACGRPDWLEDMLFAKEAPSCMIVDLEHLSAEPYARELHLMGSLTRSSKVKKTMFLPGFDEGSGGLVLDRSFKLALERASSEAGRADLRRELAAGLGLPPGAEGAFWIPVFSYERDYGPVVADLAVFAARGGPDPVALAAAGKSQGCFMAAWEAAGRPFPAIALPFLPQEAWDGLLAASDFSIVRGEDSWARAALAGRPFLWQAYPQAERYQMVKVEAFLRRLQRHFRPADFGPIARLYRAFNDRDRDEGATSGDESLLPLLEAYGTFSAGFGSFGASLAGLTGLAADLLTFFRETV
jgi:uncharacterized repeat protein (TIGR03837 family)